MSGLIALIGGSEHTLGCEPIDRRLLAESGQSRPTVAVLPAASAPARLAFKMNEARRYWSALGAAPRFGLVGGPDEEETALAALADPDLIVLTGGRPWLLHARLRGPVLDRLLQRWRAGVPVSGSSAGAMALCEHRVLIDPSRPPRLTSGLGLVPGAAAIPHVDRYGLRHWSMALARRHPRVSLLGLPDRTALIGRGQDFQVVGAGGCIMLQGGSMRRAAAGTKVRLDGRAPPAGDLPATGARRQHSAATAQHGQPTSDRLICMADLYD